MPTLKQNRKILAKFRTYFIHDLNGKCAEELSILMKKLNLNIDMTDEDIKNTSEKYFNLLIDNIKEEMPSVKELKAEIKKIKETGKKCKAYSKMNKAELIAHLEELKKEDIIEDIIESKYDQPEAKTKKNKTKKTKTKKTKILKKEMDKLEPIEPSKPIKKKFIKNVKGFTKINPEIVRKLTSNKKRPVRPKLIFRGSKGDLSDEEEPEEKFDSYNIFVNDNVFVVRDKMQDIFIKSSRILKEIEKIKERKKNTKNKTALKLIQKDEKELEKTVKRLLNAKK